MSRSYIINDINQFTLTARRVVFNGFGKPDTDNEADFLALMEESSPEDTQEMNKVLTHQESLKIVKEYVKIQKHKVTKEKRYIMNDNVFSEILNALNNRLVSNILSDLVSRNLIETAFDEKLNDFVFWTKPDENNTTNSDSQQT